SAAGEKMKQVDSWFKEVKTSGNSLFNALPGGFRYNDGTFDYIGERGKSYYCATFWASEDMAEEKGWYIFLANGNETAGSSEVNKIDGLSVRCIKD
ncbi:MAG: FISUMP domain-containing protein, partial [Bacteroidota bacterium]|nr:FISUMP domain-containing protein [Bacteroidota bacterium]